MLPRDGDLAWECVDVDVVADEVRNVAFTPRPGGRLAIDESFAPGDPRDGTLRVYAADGPHETDVEIPLERRAQGRGWEAPFALRPGTWRGTLALDPSDEAVTGVTFEIVDGETTRVAGDAISPRAGAAPR